MFKTNKKEQFSKAYVCALAAQLGFNYAEQKVDDESMSLPVLNFLKMPARNFRF